MSKIVEIMPCLDMQAGRVVKGVHFVDIADAGDPVECAKAYCAAGADQLALLDITATVENRGTLVNVVRNVAAAATVPFTVGGGISDLKSAEAVLSAGADKISTSSAAFRKPDLIPALIKEFGADKITVAIDVDRNDALVGKYHAVTHALIGADDRLSRNEQIIDMRAEGTVVGLFQSGKKAVAFKINHDRMLLFID